MLNYIFKKSEQLVQFLWMIKTEICKLTNRSSSAICCSHAVSRPDSEVQGAPEPLLPALSEKRSQMNSWASERELLKEEKKNPTNQNTNKRTGRLSATGRYI